MKLGFMTAILGDQSIEEIVPFAAAHGFECLEVMCWPPTKAERRYSGVTHLNVDELASDTVVERTKELFASHNIEISALGYYPNPLDPDAAAAKVAVSHLEKLIDLAPRLGVGLVNTFAGRDPAKSIDANWPRFVSVFEPLVQRAADRGIRLGIENCPMLFTGDEWPGGKNLAHTPVIWRRMFEAIESPNFGLNFDPSHMIWQRMDYLKPIVEFRDRIFHVHAKDARVDQHRLDDCGILAAPLAYHTPKLPGLGDVNWGLFCGMLGEVGYTGPVCIEVEDRAYEGSLHLRQASLVQSGRYLSNFLPTKIV